MYDELVEGLRNCIIAEEPEFRLTFLEGFGFTHVGYEGTQARNNVSNIQQGLFDIFVDTGSRYDRVTHREILSDIYDYDLQEESRQIWSGEHPQEVTDDEDHLEILTTLALLMFEQEVNWGRREIGWQRNTPYFYPYKNNRVTERRPRDQLMGYIDWLFQVEDIEELEFWLERTGRTTLSPSNPRDRFAGLHPTLARIVSEYGDSGGYPVMVGDTLEEFNQLAQLFENNPHYSG